MDSFQISTLGFPATEDEWSRALRVPDGDVGRAVRELVERRKYEQGRRLGEMTNSLLAIASPGFEVTRVGDLGLDKGWRVVIDRRCLPPLNLDLAQEDVDVVSSGEVQGAGLQRFKEQVFRQIGREDLLNA